MSAGDRKRGAADRPAASAAAPTLRARLAHHLDPRLWDGPGLSGLNMAVVGLILLSILVAVLGTEPAVYDGHETAFLVVEISLTSLLVLEYSARVWCSVENPIWGGSRLRFMMTPVALLDLATVVVILATAFDSEGFLMRLAMLLRVLRLARVGRFSLAFDTLVEAVSRRSMELGLSVGVSAGLLLLSSAAMYLVEAETQPEAFGSIPRAMWWSVATLTTVGYGDVYPVTVAGRLFAALTAVTGIGLIAMPTGILASAFSDAFQARREAAGVVDPAAIPNEPAAETPVDQGADPATGPDRATGP
ncbi:ion transporter [Roseospira navarrensis]|uniref:Ion transporter n=1 Tax=Roseospira navarrensis TaxID=140058 RepID=A0A7X1ZGW4_9PROT|nr:ion transporter [Roseospira navarrensis]MQX38323.1 ion transporter [Roseospira navarrensis]